MSPHRSTPRALTAALALAAALMVTPATAATITVTTVSDNNPPLTNGVCSLREALANASNDEATFPDCPAGDGNDMITFGNHLFTAGNQYVATINLSGRLVAGTPSGTAHTLSITTPVLSGPQFTRVRLVASSGSPHAVLDVLPTAAPFLMSRTSIEGGRGSGGGGGIRLLSHDAIFSDVHFIDNEATAGGALYQHRGKGTLTILNSLFRDNRATDAGGGAIEFDRIEPGHQVVIVDSDFVDNTASGDGGAIRLGVNDSFSGTDTPSVLITRTRFVDNSSGDQGGGIHASAEANADQRLLLHIRDGLFQRNRAYRGGGGLYAGGYYLGAHTRVQIERSSFLDNRSIQLTASGGGIYAWNVDAHVDNSLFARNETGLQGGAVNFSTNSASHPRTLAFIGNSFHRNVQVGGGAGRTLALKLPPDSLGWTVTLAGNLFDPAAQPPASTECYLNYSSAQPPTLHGNDNLSPASDCLFFGAADIHAAPGVAASDSGNPLKPMLLLPQPGSPAIDAWPAEACTDPLGQPLSVDLRGNPRPADADGSGAADCDIGAFELPDHFADRIHADGFE